MEDKKLHNSSKIKKIEEQKPLFTVALVTFCQRHLLEDCLDSIFNQDYDNIELIVCDDCSCDFDPDDVRNYIDENKSENIKNVVIFKHEHNVGTVKNCQKAFELSNGAYFKLQAGDDVFFGENVLSTIYREFQKKVKTENQLS